MSGRDKCLEIEIEKKRQLDEIKGIIGSDNDDQAKATALGVALKTSSEASEASGNKEFFLAAVGKAGKEAGKAIGKAAGKVKDKAKSFRVKKGDKPDNKPDNKPDDKPDKPDPNAPPKTTWKDKLKSLYNTTTGLASTGLLAYAIISSFTDMASQNSSDSTLVQKLNQVIGQKRKMEIENGCEQNALSVQRNVLDNTMCNICNPDPFVYDPQTGEVLRNRYGEPFMIPDSTLMAMKSGIDPEEFCKAQNFRQSNVAKMEASCLIQNIITDLIEAQGDIAAQATARILQDAQGLLSQNESEAEVCQNISQNITQDDYLKVINDCVQNSNNVQENITNWCGPTIDSVQDNVFNNIPQCIINNTVDKEMKASGKIDANAELIVDQKASMLPFDIDAILMIILIVIIVCVVLISLSSAYTMFSSSNSTPSPDASLPPPPPMYSPELENPYLSRFFNSPRF